MTQKKTKHHYIYLVLYRLAYNVPFATSILTTTNIDAHCQRHILQRISRSQKQELNKPPFGFIKVHCHRARTFTPGAIAVAKSRAQGCMVISHPLTPPSTTYDHTHWKTRDPVRSPIDKSVRARLVVGSVTTSESLVLNVFFLLFFLLHLFSRIIAATTPIAAVIIRPIS